MTAASCRYCQQVGTLNQPIEHTPDCPITTGKYPVGVRTSDADPGAGRPGDPRAVELGRVGGKASGESRRRKAASDPLTRGLLGHLLGLSTGDWMTRLGLVEPSWGTWRIVGKVLDGLPLSDAETVTYHQL